MSQKQDQTERNELDIISKCDKIHHLGTLIVTILTVTEQNSNVPDRNNSVLVSIIIILQCSLRETETFKS